MAITRTVAGMWIFTQNGFFSIVRKGGPGLCVRARDLDQLRSLLREHLPADSPGDKDIKILEQPSQYEHIIAIETRGKLGFGSRFGLA